MFLEFEFVKIEFQPKIEFNKLEVWRGIKKKKQELEFRKLQPHAIHQFFFSKNVLFIKFCLINSIGSVLKLV